MRRIARLLFTFFLILTIAPLLVTQVNAQSKPKGDITVWMWKQDWDNVVNSKIIDDFNKEYPDIKVNRVDISSTDVYQKLPLAISAGTGKREFLIDIGGRNVDAVYLKDRKSTRLNSSHTVISYAV